jgi:hypothetical protein
VVFLAGDQLGGGVDRRVDVEFAPRRRGRVREADVLAVEAEPLVLRSLVSSKTHRIPSLATGVTASIGKETPQMSVYDGNAKCWTSIIIGRRNPV